MQIDCTFVEIHYDCGIEASKAYDALYDNFIYVEKDGKRLKVYIRPLNEQKLTDVLKEIGVQTDRLI